jgi:DNA-binding SARP family transcriptional activator/tetratricopeptide (TPR) repeat protein
MHGLELRALGPVELRVDGRPIALRAKVAALAALLALEANQVVDRDRLIEQLWTGSPPQGAAATLRAYVYQLRRCLASDGQSVLIGRHGGYLLELDHEAVDADRFTALAAAGRDALRRGRREDASAAFRTASDLWHGDEAFPRIDVPAVRERARQLEGLRLEVLEQRYALELELGLPGPAVAELEPLTAAHPLREGLWRLLMLGLYRAGRQSEALDAYRRLRRILREALGTGPSAEVERLHAQVLANDPGLLRPVADTVRRNDSGPCVPRQLPAAPAHFTGRTTQLAALDELFQDGRPAPGVVAITGTGGIGKTALALHWAHRAADRFPDGQLYIDLRGFGPADAPLAQRQAVRTLLESLGTPPAASDDLDAQAALLRTVLADKRVLLLLDNARNTDQIRPLLPASPGSLVVVTSRNRLPGLVVQGARPLVLTGLDTEEADRYLSGRIGAARTAAEPAAAEEIIDACAGLPLALAVVAARAAAHPEFPLRAQAADLRDTDSRLDALGDTDDSTDLRAVFSWSYRALTPDAAHLFRILSEHPGPDVTATAAASLAAVPQRRARVLLAELAQANMVIERHPGRYAFHDLLRSYASDLAATEETPVARDAAAGRMLDHYLHTAVAAGVLIDEPMDPIATRPHDPGVTPERLPDSTAARAWFDAETAVLTAAVEQAAVRRFDDHCCWLAWAVSDHLLRTGHWHSLIAVWETAREAARRLGDDEALSRAHYALGLARTRLGHFDAAHDDLANALRLREQRGDQPGQAHVLVALSRLARRQDRSEAVLTHLLRALDLYEHADHRLGRARALHTIGWQHALEGRYQEAFDHCERAMRLFEGTDDLAGLSATLDSLGCVHHRSGNFDEAVAHFRRSLEIARDLGIRYGEAITLTNLGETQLALGDRAGAGDSLRAALRLLDDLGHADAAQVRAKLDQLAAPSPA